MSKDFERMHRQAERTQSYWVEMILLYADMKRPTKWVKQLAKTIAEAVMKGDAK